MTTTAYAKVIQEHLVAPLQTLYNLNWKNQGKATASKSYESGTTSITFWPTALDYHFNGKVYQVKWELDDNKVINVTFPHVNELPGLIKFLKRYLWG